MFICTLFACLHIHTALAQDNLDKANKNSFKTKWEAHIASLPETEIFEKTDIPNIYNFKTTLFDFDGQIELLNIVIHDNIPYYHNYELKDESKLIGVAEIELKNIDDNFFDNRYYSHQIWEENHFLFWQNGNWITEIEWEEAASSAQTSSETQSVKSCNTNNKKAKDWLSILIGFLPIVLLIIFYVIFGRRCQKDSNQKIDISLEKQTESIQYQKEAMALIKKQNNILQQILDQKK